MKKVLVLFGVFALLTLSLLGLASCGSDPSYYISNVTYDPIQKKLDWDDNSDADKWIVVINGEKDKVSDSEISFDAEDKDFTFSIEGLHKKKGHEDNPTVSGTMKFLAKVQNLRIQDGMLCWDAVPGASSYEIYNFENWIDEVSTNTAPVPAGSFSFTVVPKNSSFSYTYTPDAITGTILQAPYDLKYEEGFISWSYLDTCDYFLALINGEEYKTTDKQIAYDGNAKDITISVKACTNGLNSYDSQFLTDTCYYLKPITEYSFDESGNLVWAPVEHAARYLIDLNGALRSVTEPVLGDLELDTVYTVEITPAGEGILYYTGTPMEYTFEKLSPIENVRFDSQTNTITWDRHLRATSYELIVNGELFKSNEPRYTIGRTEKDIAIQVYACGSINNSKSYFAEKTNYTYMGSLGSPTVVDGKLVWTGSAKAVRYRVTFADQSYKETEAAELTDFTKGVQHTVTVTAFGENEYYFTYPTAQFTFYVLHAPILSFSQNNIIWNTIPNANGYYADVKRDGGDFDSKTLPVGGMAYGVTGFVEPGSYAVRVKATSSTVGVYDSEYSTAFEVVRLGVSTGHTILNDTNRTDHLEIALNEVNGAKGYLVSYNNVENFYQADRATMKLDLLGPTATTDAETFAIRVKTLGSNETSSPVYLDSLTTYNFTVRKLATPKNVRVEGQMVRWDAVNGANGYIVSVDGTNQVANTTELMLTNLAEGDHQIWVYATSQAVDTVNSRASAKVAVKKLPKVNNVRIEPTGDQIVLKWDTVNGASTYLVKVGTEEFTPSGNVHNLTATLNTITAGLSRDIVVYAKGNGSTVMDSEPSNTITVAKYTAPTGLSVSGSNLVWSACTINGVTCNNYELKITPVGGSPMIKNVSGTSYPTTELPAGQYTVEVKACGDKQRTLDSDYSGYVPVTKLGAITNIQGVAGTTTLTWDAVPGAQNYLISIGNDQRQVTTNSVDLKDLITTAQEYTIVITARSGDPNTINGNATEYRLTPKKLNKPTFSETAGTAGTFTVSQSGANVTVTVQAPTENVPQGNLQYRFQWCGLPTTGTATTFTKTMDVPGFSYDLTVQYVIHCFGNDGSFYLSSDPSNVKYISYT